MSAINTNESQSTHKTSPKSILSVKNLRLLAYASFAISVIYTAVQAIFNVMYSFDLISELYFYTGIFALSFTFISAFFSLFQFKKTKIYPRLFGIYAGFWALAHFGVYFVFSKNLSLIKLYNDISKRIFEASGFVAFVLMFFMLLSSFEWGKRLEKIRKLGYLCLFVASYHYFLSAKIPEFWHYLALIMAGLFFVYRYTKGIFKKKRL